MNPTPSPGPARHGCLRRNIGIAALCVSAAALACLAVSCQSAKDRTPAWNAPHERLVWPQPPEQARIEYVGALHSAADIGERVGFTRSVVNLVVGRKEEGMVKPAAVARNRNGLLIVADPGVPTVHFFDLDRRKYWRPKDKAVTALQSPVGVAVTDAGTVYVADSDARAIFVFDIKARLISQFGQKDFARPTAVALNPAQDRLYVTDTESSQIVTFSLEGVKLSEFGERGENPGQFNYPTFLGVANDGTLCISDSLNFRVQMFTPEGVFKSAWGKMGDTAGSFARPKGVAFDSFGQVYVADGGFENVQIFSPDGGLLLGFGEPGSGPGAFCLPMGMCIDATNTIWVADSYNHRVQAFALHGDSQ